MSLWTCSQQRSRSEYVRKVEPYISTEKAWSIWHRLAHQCGLRYNWQSRQDSHMSPAQVATYKAGFGLSYTFVMISNGDYLKKKKNYCQCAVLSFHPLKLCRCRWQAGFQITRYDRRDPRPCTIYCFALVQYAWITKPKRFYKLVP